MQTSVTVTLKLEPLKKFQKELERDLKQNTNGPIRKAIKQWAARFRSFVQERFDKYSKGGGDWAPLAESTKRGRRGGAGAKHSILRDTGTLFAALAPEFRGGPGQLQEDIPFGVRVGFGGPGLHPNGNATVADIAGFHQTGGPHLPQRKIIVEPDKKTTDKMAEDLERALKQLLDDTDAG